jgi:hypothetical protein
MPGWNWCTGTINKSINVTSVAMIFTEEFMPAIHQKSLGLIVFVRFMPYAKPPAKPLGCNCVQVQLAGAAALLPRAPSSEGGLEGGGTGYCIWRAGVCVE